MAWSFYDSTGQVLQGVLAVSIDTTELADDAVTSAKIATDAVIADGIAANAVGASELANDAVDTAAIANDAVTYVKMQNLGTADRVLGSTSTGVIGEVQIVPDMLASNAVTTAKILDANVTLAKVASQAANTVLVRDASSSGVVSAKAVTDTQILIGDGTGFTAAALSGDVTMANSGATTIATDAVDIAMLSATGTASSSTFLRGDNAWEAAASALQSTIVSGTQLASGILLYSHNDAPTATTITGAGFAPTAAIIFYANNADEYAGIGMADDADVGVSLSRNDLKWLIGGSLIQMNNNGFNAMTGSLTSLDSNGCTLSWLKYGSGIDTNFKILFLR